MYVPTVCTPCSTAGGHSTRSRWSMYSMMLLHFQFLSCLDHAYHEGSCLVSYHAMPCNAMPCHAMPCHALLLPTHRAFQTQLIFAKAESESPRNEAITFPLCTLPINTGNA
uniref:Uncharacterized protein n=1 Tax=Chaetoceros debilis TaxID=122233 RepID=A0A6S8U1D2_9STRA